MKTLTKMAATLLGLSGVFIAFGYVSLRAHLAIIGVPWDTSLGAERYLAEAYQLALGIIDPILSYLPKLTLLAVIVVLGGILSRWKPMPLKEPLAQIGGLLQKLHRSWLLPAILTLVALGFYPFILRNVDFDRTASFVGPLEGVSYYYLPGFFTVLVLFCLATYALYDGIRRTAFRLSRGARLWWRIATASVVVLIFCAPVVYGTFWHPMLYPVVKVSLKGHPTVECGVLILKGDRDLLLWRAAQRKGELLTIPTDEVYAFTAGEGEDIRKWVDTAIYTGGASPDCGELSDPPSESH